MKGESLFAFLGGALVGAAVAILLAPDSGANTRKKIVDTAEKGYQNVKDRVMEEVEKVKEKVDKAKA